ncbi:hypothetical protein ACFL0K_02885 [Patescibacteria group bacterium]
MFLYITLSITLVAAVVLISAILFRYWEIRVGRVPVRDTAAEIGFWDYVYRIHEYIVRKSMHHGSKFRNLLLVKIAQLIEVVLDYHHVKKITGMVKGQQEITGHKDTASGYLKDITERKNEIREEQSSKE